MRGPEIIARTISVPRPVGKEKRLWQYNSRSNTHGKIACWAVMFDLLRHSSLLRQHLAEGKVSFAIDRQMNNWQTGLKKNLDLVVARAGSETSAVSMVSLAETLKLQLTASDWMELETLPASPLGAAGATVLVALEAKAAMTEHGKARPRLFAELDASHSVIHGDNNHALAVGFAMVNIADRFVSSTNQRGPEVHYNNHNQPADAIGVIQKLRELPRRSGPHSGQPGFDAFGILVVDLVNDLNSPMSIVTDDPAPTQDNDFNYARMITRTAHLYDANFGNV
jgi:hypothetical protein